MTPGSTVVWLRQDLRLADHAPLADAASRGGPVVPVFVWAPEEEAPWAPGPAARRWLRASLEALDGALRERGSRLVVRKGPSLEALRDVAREVGADRVVWHRRLEPALAERDRAIRDTLDEDGLEVRTHAGRILHDPDAVRTTAGGPYRVFTPFHRRFEERVRVGEPLEPPRLGAGRAPGTWPDSEPLSALGLVDGGGEEVPGGWEPGEAGAARRLGRFLDEALLDYPERRDRPDLASTSRLSPHLHHGEISPRQLWRAVSAWVGNRVMKGAADAFLRQLAWREFSYHVLHHFPKTPSEPLQESFAGFPWRDPDGEARDAMERWREGRTGYPVVDAGMRQLRHTGWIHNRVRMIVASFLTRDLLLPWQQGARWFWDTLVDADLANNTMGWQWSAGSGADPQPFFRIFNPVSQGRRHDPEGRWVRRWIPELADLPGETVHAPWEASDDDLRDAGVVLGSTYPRTVVDHARAREEALAAWEEVR